MRIVIQGETPAKKNSRITLRNGKSIPSARYRAWREAAIPQIWAGAKGERIPLGQAVKVSMDFFHGDLRRRDCDNGATSVLDALVDAKVLPDDRWEIVRELRARNFYDKGNARVEVSIEPLAE